jgi:hypothetical protein
LRHRHSTRFPPSENGGTSFRGRGMTLYENEDAVAVVAQAAADWFGEYL